MSIIIKMFIALFIIGFSGLFILKQPDGKPWLSLNEFLPDRNTIKTITPSRHNHDDKQTIYRWKDASGQWQFSDKPPAENASEEIQLSGHLNRDLAEKVTTKTKPTTSTENNPAPTKNTEHSTKLSPENIAKLMDDAKNVQHLINDRNAQLNTQ